MLSFKLHTVDIAKLLVRFTTIMTKWQQLASDPPSPQQSQVLKWIRERVSVYEYFQPFGGTFKGKQYDCDRPPMTHFRNYFSCIKCC